MFLITSSWISIISEIIFSHSCSIVSTSPPISSSINLNTSVLHSNVNILLTSSSLQFLEKQGRTKQGSNSLILDNLSPFSSKNYLRMLILEGLSSLSSMQYQMQIQHSNMLIFVLTLSRSSQLALFFLIACKIISQYYLTSPLQLPPFRKICIMWGCTSVMGLTCFMALDSLMKTDSVLVILRDLRKEMMEAQSRLDYDIFWQFLICRDWLLVLASQSSKLLLAVMIDILKCLNPNIYITHIGLSPSLPSNHSQECQSVCFDKCQHTQWLIIKNIASRFSIRRMKKVYIFANKEEIKRSSTTSKPITLQKPLQPIAETYKYYVGSGNNHHLIRKIMSTRKNWEETTDSKQAFLSLKWQQSNKGYNYQNCSNKKVYKHVLNHFQYHPQLSNKEYMFRNIVEYCQANKLNAFDYIPITFILNTLDANFQAQQSNFIAFYNERNTRKDAKVKNFLAIRKKAINMSTSLQLDKKQHMTYSKFQIRDVYSSPNSQYLWILKPTFYNRGNGVHVFNNLTQLQTLMNKYISGTVPEKGNQTNELTKKYQITSNNLFIIQSTSFVIQKYMQRPLLYNGRKFDIRVWVLITHQMKAYLFKEGYLRLSSNKYDLSEDKIVDQCVHLTNNAVQKYNQDYNKFQKGNQLSFRVLKAMLEQKGKNFTEFINEMKFIIKMSALSVKRKLNRFQRDNCFQIFGYDFMVDEKECKPWLIEINTNPCIEQSSPLLEQLIPRMIDNAFSLTIDKIFNTEKTSYSYVVENQNNNENLWEMIVDLKK